MMILSDKEVLFSGKDPTDNLLPKCYICKEVPSKGIRDGFMLSGQFICIKCEEKILTLSYNDPAYNLMVEKLKKVINKKKRSYKI